MRSGHKSNAVCTAIMKHFNAQSDHSPKLRDNITYSISVMDRHCSRSETSHFIDRSSLISVHDITTCMNVHVRYIILERLKNMHKQQSSFQSSLVKCCVSLRQDLYEARLSVMLMKVIKIAHLVLRT